MRRLSYTALPEDAGSRLQSVLRRAFHLSQKQIRQLKFLEDGITVNRQRRRIDYVVEANDQICVTFSDRNRKPSRVTASDRPLSILYEDEDLLILDKAAGEVCHPSHGHYQDTLANQVSAYLSGCGEEFPMARCIGRLDKDTSGVLLFAKNQYAARQLLLQKEQGVFYKEYLALVNGSFDRDSRKGEICLPLAPDPDSLMKMQVSFDGKKARTFYHVLCSDRNCSLVLCRIYTGRTHQIRVHMAAVGHPLLGDPLYGNDRYVSSSRTALHAWRLFLRQPATGKDLLIESFRSRQMFC